MDAKVTTVTRGDFDEYMVPNYAPSDVIPVDGLGSKVWDQLGKEYIDFAGGIAVNCLGHKHPQLVNTLKTQGEKIWHLANVMTNEPALKLAKNLVDNTFADKVYYANSGAEANEAALKLARRWALDNFGEEKSEIISFNQAFHGRTFFTVSVGGKAVYSDGFGPKPGSVSHADFNDLASVEAIISDKTCAIIVEPVQGEGGVLPATTEFLSGLRALADKHNALLIFDEVQTGVGRTGTLYAYEQYNVHPDILTTAKALGGGFPIGAMITTTEVAKHLVPGTHGSTYGGNPLACAVANTVFDIVNDEALLKAVREKSALFMKTLSQINERKGLFSNIRGMGLLIGAELKPEFADKGKAIVKACERHGLMILVAGPKVVRFAPSLIVEDAVIKEGLKRFEDALNELFPEQD